MCCSINWHHLHSKRTQLLLQASVTTASLPMLQIMCTRAHAQCITEAVSAAAGRLSYVFGLSGPSVAVDTACSSSLVAVGQAHNALMLGVVPACLAGGVNLLLSPHTHAMYAVAGKSPLKSPAAA